MAIALGDFVNHIFRESQYGQTGIYTDQTVTDVVASINKRGARIWGRADWKWKRELLEIDLVADTRQYVVAAASGNDIDRILSIIPYDPTMTFLQGEPLTERTTRAFYARVTQPPWRNADGGGSSASNRGYPTDYYNLGTDSNGDWNIIVDPVPSAVGKLGGYAKAVLTTYTVANVVSNIAIAYFPNDVVLDCLFEGVMSDVERVKGDKVEAVRLDQSFQAKLKQLVSEQIGVATDETPIVTAMPPTVNKMRARRGR